MTAIIIALCVGFFFGVVATAWGESARMASARRAAYEAGEIAEARRESERRSVAGTKAAATRRRNRAPSPLFVEGAVPTDSEGAE